MYYRIYNWSYIVWSVFNAISTMITIFGTYKIIKTMQELQKINASIKTNYFQLTLHALVLTFNLIPVIIQLFPYAWLTGREWLIVGIMLIVTETLS
jgi:hypothetical protein